MLLGGDELGRTQGGNNNAYCQDNEISWVDWSQPDEKLLAFTRRLVAFRRTHPVFRRRRFLVGIEAAQLAWYTPSATPMTMENWADPNARALAIYLEGGDDPDLAADGTPLVDDDFLVLVNGWWEKLGFRIPDIGGGSWRVELDTYDPAPPTGPDGLHAGDDVTLGPSPPWCCRATTQGDGGPRNSGADDQPTAMAVGRHSIRAGRGRITAPRRLLTRTVSVGQDLADARPPVRFTRFGGIQCGLRRRCRGSSSRPPEVWSR
jgi:hypothetical protein